MRYKKAGRLAVIALLVLQAAFTGLLLVAPATLFPVDRILSNSQTGLVPTNAIYDRAGRLIYTLNDPASGTRFPIPLEQIPLALRQAVIATEDATFYTNPGFDMAAILRAAWMNLREGRIVAGASTITQQVVRQHLPADIRYQQTLVRKLREILGAFVLARNLSKDEILNQYLNDSYFGHRAYGVEAAAWMYFNKPVTQLDLAECALLAGLPQSPVRFDPLLNPTAATERQRIVLNLIVQHGVLTPGQATLAATEPLRFISAPEMLDALHFSMIVSHLLPESVGESVLQKGGLRIYTTLDLDIQHTSEQQLNRQLTLLNQQTDTEPSHNVHNGAVVVIEPSTGAIRALVGSPNYLADEVDGAFNAALALRQPGSALKPITYAAAFVYGLTPATMIADVPTSFTSREGQPYSPQNYDQQYHGPVLLRQALACSYNIVAVKVLDQIGIGSFSSLARRMGISSLDDASRYGLALTLGGVEVSLLELTTAYGVLANGGWQVKPFLIERIEDNSGQVLYQADPITPTRVLDERIAYLITDILSDPLARLPAFGASSALELPFPAAVKTGTTSEWRDNWTIGYSSQYVVGVWVGNADNQPMVQVSGVTGAAPIWNSIMRSIHTTEPAPIARPQGITEVTVCALSGELPGPACTQLRQELFLTENVPQNTCTLHQFSQAGDIISPEKSTVIVWPPELLNWAHNQGLATAPGSLSQASATLDSQDKPSLSIESPADHAIYLLNPGLPADAQQIDISGYETVAFERITVYLDDIPYITWQSAPLRTLWPLHAGTHTLYLEGITVNGSSTRSSVVTFSVEQVSP